MLDPNAVEEMLERLRVARLAGDVDQIMAFFHDDATFKIVGFGEPVRGKAAVASALRRLIADFDFIEYRPGNVFIDGDHLGYRYGLTFRYVPSGTTAETEVFDHIAMKEGKIFVYTQHGDTALLKALVSV